MRPPFAFLVKVLLFDQDPVVLAALRKQHSVHSMFYSVQVPLDGFVIMHDGRMFIEQLAFLQP